MHYHARCGVVAQLSFFALRDSKWAGSAAEIEGQSVSIAVEVQADRGSGMVDHRAARVATDRVGRRHEIGEPMAPDTLASPLYQVIHFLV
jgi:hypothetical protein